MDTFRVTKGYTTNMGMGTSRATSAHVAAPLFCNILIYS